MKKELIAGIFAAFIIISVLNFVYAQDAEDLSEEARNIGEDIKGKSAELLETEKASQGMQNFAEIFFRVGKQISFSQFVIMCVLFFFVFFFLVNILSLSYFSGWVKYIIAGGLAGIMALSGGIYLLAFWIFSLAKTIDFLNKIGYFATFVFLFIIAVVFFTVMFLLSLIRRKLQPQEAEIEGLRAGLAVRFMKIFKDMFR